MSEISAECREAVPSVEDYCALRRLAGLSPKTAQAAACGLPNTLYAVSFYEGGRLVAMGRLIGDGGCHLQVVDVAVLPERQGRGLGKAVMQRLCDWLQHNAPASAYVSLLADGQAHRLYAQFGFAPTAPASVGMALRIGPLPA
jgi:GNAT superfamily N-acetyltransferase